VPTAAVIGAGPAGLMAAEVLARAGVTVTVYDRMPSPGRKLLMAGRGGLNLTHSEPLETFLARYGEARGRLAPLIAAFPPDALIAWLERYIEAVNQMWASRQGMSAVEAVVSPEPSPLPKPPSGKRSALVELQPERGE